MIIYPVIVISILVFFVTANAFISTPYWYHVWAAFAADDSRIAISYIALAEKERAGSFTKLFSNVFFIVFPILFIWISKFLNIKMKSYVICVLFLYLFANGIDILGLSLLEFNLGKFKGSDSEAAVIWEVARVKWIWLRVAHVLAVTATVCCLIWLIFQVRPVIQMTPPEGGAT